MGKQNSLGLVVLFGAVIGAVVWLAKKKPTEGAPPGVPPGGGGGAGKANLLGLISNITVGQVQMASHLLGKGYGAAIQVSVFGNNGVTDFKGAPIAWPMTLVIRLGHSTLFGWKTAAELGFAGGGADVSLGTVAPGGFSRGPYTFATPADPDQVWDVHVELLAQASEPDGTPAPQSVLKLGEAFHDGAIRSLAPAPGFGPAKLLGSISTVQVLQSRRRFGVRR